MSTSASRTSPLLVALIVVTGVVGCFSADSPLDPAPGRTRRSHLDFLGAARLIRRRRDADGDGADENGANSGAISPVEDEKKMDTAKLIVLNNSTQALLVFSIPTACDGCPLQYLTYVAGRRNSSAPPRQNRVFLSTVWRHRFNVTTGPPAPEGWVDVGVPPEALAVGLAGNETGTVELDDTCVDMEYSFWEGGEYRLTIDDAGFCRLEETTPPPTPFLPILYAFLVLAAAPLLCEALPRMWKMIKSAIASHRNALSESAKRRAQVEMESGNRKSEGAATPRTPASSGDSSSPASSGVESTTGSRSTVATDVDDEADKAAASASDLSPVVPGNAAGKNRISGAAAAAAGAAERKDAKNDATSGKKEKEKSGGKTKRKRVESLDTFRGLSIVLMIFVNYGGGGYAFFEHAPWDGVHLADFVFPWFIWIMGVSMAFAIRGAVKKGISKKRLVSVVFVRTLKLFFLGIVLNTAGGWVELSGLRIPGVLQRFAAAYGMLAGLEIIFAGMDDAPVSRDSHFRFFVDIIASWPMWVVNLALVFLHLAITYGLPVPGCPTGYVGPGGLHDGARHWNCTGGAAGYVDKLFYGVNHIYQNPTVKILYRTEEPFDPEGLLGNLTSIFLTFLGVVAGRVIVFYSDTRGRLTRFAAWGVALCLLTVVLCQGSMSEGAVPINKNLWSLSFVTLTGGVAFLLLGLLYYIIDVRRFWSGYPLREAGMNAITLYVGHQVLAGYFPIRWATEDTHLNSMFFSCWGTFIWIYVAVLMHDAGTFITL